MNRGDWSKEDVEDAINKSNTLGTNNFGGVQIWNDQPVDQSTGISQFEGFLNWKKFIQDGVRVPLLAGSDAHGSFGFKFDESTFAKVFAKSVVVKGNGLNSTFTFVPPGETDSVKKSLFEMLFFS